MTAGMPSSLLLHCDTDPRKLSCCAGWCCIAAAGVDELQPAALQAGAVTVLAACGSLHGELRCLIVVCRQQPRLYVLLIDGVL